MSEDFMILLLGIAIVLLILAMTAALVVAVLAMVGVFG